MAPKTHLKSLRIRNPSSFRQTECVIDEAGAIRDGQSFVILKQQLTQRLPVLGGVVDAVVAELEFYRTLVFVT